MFSCNYAIKTALHQMRDGGVASVDPAILVEIHNAMASHENKSQNPLFANLFDGDALILACKTFPIEYKAKVYELMNKSIDDFREMGINDYQRAQAHLINGLIANDQLTTDEIQNFGAGKMFSAILQNSDMIMGMDETSYSNITKVILRGMKTNDESKKLAFSYLELLRRKSDSFNLSKDIDDLEKAIKPLSNFYAGCIEDILNYKSEFSYYGGHYTLMALRNYPYLLKKYGEETIDAMYQAEHSQDNSKHGRTLDSNFQSAILSAIQNSKDSDVNYTLFTSALDKSPYYASRMLKEGKDGFYLSESDANIALSFINQTPVGSSPAYYDAFDKFSSSFGDKIKQDTLLEILDNDSGIKRSTVIGKRLSLRIISHQVKNGQKLDDHLLKIAFKKSNNLVSIAPVISQLSRTQKNSLFGNHRITKQRDVSQRMLENFLSTNTRW